MNEVKAKEGLAEQIVNLLAQAQKAEADVLVGMPKQGERDREQMWRTYQKLAGLSAHLREALEDFCK